MTDNRERLTPGFVLLGRGPCRRRSHCSLIANHSFSDGARFWPSQCSSSSCRRSRRRLTRCGVGGLASLRARGRSKDDGRTFPFAQLREVVDVFEQQHAVHLASARQGRLNPWVFHHRAWRRRPCALFAATPPCHRPSTSAAASCRPQKNLSLLSKRFLSSDTPVPPVVRAVYKGDAARHASAGAELA